LHLIVSEESLVDVDIVFKGFLDDCHKVRSLICVNFGSVQGVVGFDVLEQSAEFFEVNGTVTVSVGSLEQVLLLVHGYSIYELVEDFEELRG
jgi:hypothetical protein